MRILPLLASTIAMLTVGWFSPMSALVVVVIACFVFTYAIQSAQTCEDAGEDGADWEESYITRTHDRSNAA